MNTPKSPWLKKNILIYGTGKFACDILDVLSRHKLTVSGFLDHAPRQLMIRDLPVTQPDAIADEIRLASVIVLDIHNREAKIASIISRQSPWL